MLSKWPILFRADWVWVYYLFLSIVHFCQCIGRNTRKRYVTAISVFFIAIWTQLSFTTHISKMSICIVFIIFFNALITAFVSFNFTSFNRFTITVIVKGFRKVEALDIVLFLTVIIIQCRFFLFSWYDRSIYLTMLSKWPILFRADWVWVYYLFLSIVHFCQCIGRNTRKRYVTTISDFYIGFWN